MRLSFGSLSALGTKIGRHARLLREDPERFGRNLMQITNPRLYQSRMLDVQNAVPMHVTVDESLTPSLNVLDAAWTKAGMTGGPNTVINLACRIAREGVPVRFVATVEDLTIDPAWFRRHATALLGGGGFPEVPLISAARPERPLHVSPCDMFLTTHWTTAQQLKAVLPRMELRRFFYMLQEFEPGFHSWSSNFALALETYGMDFWPIVNEALLADYLFGLQHGRLADPETRARAIVFEPAIDRVLFRPASDRADRASRRLLFYARPTNPRNMFGLGISALRRVATDPLFANWEFLSIGARGAVPELPLGSGRTLRPAPWVDYAGYGDLLRAADVLLCPMLSPHTSYPVLEMAACGGLSVTNTFATKTATALRALSANIMAVEPTVDGFAGGLLQAARAVRDGDVADASLDMPCDWAQSLDPVAGKVAGLFKQAMLGRPASWDRSASSRSNG